MKGDLFFTFLSKGKVYNKMADGVPQSFRFAALCSRRPRSLGIVRSASAAVVQQGSSAFSNSGMMSCELFGGRNPKRCGNPKSGSAAFFQGSAGWVQRLTGRFRGKEDLDMTPSLQPPTTTEAAEKYYGKFHQCQGSTTHCADFSMSMACHIYYDRKGRATTRCQVDKITRFLDTFFVLGYRFPPIKNGKPEGGATPGGIIAALLWLKIPFSFNPFGTLNTLEHALIDNRMIIVSQGKIMDPKEGTWGHVMVIVGMDGNEFLVLDPAQPKGTGVVRRNKNTFMNKWWYPPFHPCWVIG
jgi:hypothetical protein